MRRRSVKTALAGATAVGVIAVLSACSSSGQSAGSSSTGGSGASSSSGKTIKVLAMGQYKAAQFSLPEMQDAAKAAIDAANASGGINGAKIVLTLCNDQGDPNVAAGCARQAVTDNVAAVIGSISLYDSSVTPLLQAAHIPLIGNLPLNSTDFTSPISYPIDGGNPGDFATEGIALVQHGCTKVGIVSSSDNSSSQVSASLVKAGVTSAGGHVVTTLGIPSTAPDLSPTVASLISAGAKCVGLTLPEATQTKFVVAARQSSDPNILIAGTLASAPLPVIQASGHAFDGVLMPGGAYNPTPTQTPTFLAQMKAENPKALTDNGAEIAWTAATAFVDVARQIHGSVTGQSVIDQLNKTSALKLETYPSPLNFSKDNPNPSYARLFNTNELLYIVKNDNYVLAQPDPINVAPALK